MTFDINKGHFDKLIEFEDIVQGWVGHNPWKFAKNLGVQGDLLDNLPKGRIDRHGAFKEIKEEEDAPRIFLLIMAWGGMNRRYGRRAWQAITGEKRQGFSNWACNVREGQLNRQEAYEQFQNLEIPGIGPAYFTKLIFFLTATGSAKGIGYIMDQWTAKSADLLVSGINGHEGSIVRLDHSGYVAQNNESIRYEHFCRAVDELGNRLNVAGIENPGEIEWGAVAEERMFSIGRGQGAWRNYVVANWSRRQPVELDALMSQHE